MQKHMEFLTYVQMYVEKHPEVGAHVSEFVAKGIAASRQEAMERACDMETALAVALATRYNGREELILQKLNKWKDRASLRWDSTIEMLQKKQTKKETR